MPVEHQQVQPEQDHNQHSESNPLPENQVRHVSSVHLTTGRFMDLQNPTIEPRVSDGNIHPPVAAGGESGYFTAIVE